MKQSKQIEGFTLLETVMAAGFAAGIALVIATTQSYLGSSLQSGTSSQDYATAIAQLTALMSTEQSCRTLLTGAQTLGGTISSQSPKITGSSTATVNKLWAPLPPSPAAAASPLFDFTPSSTVPNTLGAWKITKITLTPEVSAAPNTRIPVDMTIQMQSALGHSTYKRPFTSVIRLSADLNGASRIDSCNLINYNTDQGTANYHPFGAPVCTSTGGNIQVLTSDGASLKCLSVGCTTGYMPCGCSASGTGVTCIPSPGVCTAPASCP